MKADANWLFLPPPPPARLETWWITNKLKNVEEPSLVLRAGTTVLAEVEAHKEIFQQSGFPRWWQVPLYGLRWNSVNELTKIVSKQRVMNSTASRVVKYFLEKGFDSRGLIRSKHGSISDSCLTHDFLTVRVQLIRNCDHYGDSVAKPKCVAVAGVHTGLLICVPPLHGSVT